MFCLLIVVCCIVVGTSTDPLSPGPHRVVDKLFGNTRYFVIKSNNYENVDIAKTRVSEPVWITNYMCNCYLSASCFLSLSECLVYFAIQ